MPADRSPKNRSGSVSKKVEPCNICGQVVSRASDIPRHKRTHADANKLPCPWAGCDFSTHQKSNLDTHYRSQHSKDRLFICEDDPASCHFQTFDPASRTRHRKRRHNYVPKNSIGRKTNKSNKTAAYHGRNASVDSLPSVASPFVGGSSLGSNSPGYTSPASSINSLSCSYSSPYGGSESTTSIPSIPDIPFLSINSPQYPKESLLFSGSAYDHTWNQFVLPKFNFLAAEPEMEHYESQIPYQGQQEEPHPQPKDLLPLFPKMGPVFPGLRGLDVGLEQPPHQVSSLEVNNEDRFSSLINNLPVQAFHAPVETVYNPATCSPVRTGDRELDIELGLDVGFDFGIIGNTDSTQMTPSSYNFNSFHVDPHTSVDPTVFAYPTNAQFYPAPSTPISYANVDPQTHANAAFVNFPPPTFCVGYYDFNGHINLHVYPAPTAPDYFDQCQWDFGFNTSNNIQGPYYN
ncbi:hypothetical protein BYT27DRAFT_7246248 [Phlegmacium glaucopus]|nr:hypothetical protein BYT27DRAFT_7246248 [Phlegmacium glaucopus]